LLSESNGLTKKGILILAAGPMQIPAVLTAKELGLFVIAADRNPQAPGFRFADIGLPLDVVEHAALGDWAEQHRSEYNISAVFAGADVAVAAAVINQRLRLPGIPVDVAEASHNKAKMKERWLRAGVSTPASDEVGNKNEARRLASKHGYPVMVKAVDNSASRGTQVVCSEVELEDAVENAFRHSTTSSCLVEQFVEGEEQSVETVMHQGQQLRAGMVDRHYDFFPYPIEVGHTNPSHLPADVQEQIFRVVDHAARSLGIDNGPAKADMILTKQGPMILEMPARLSGGFHSQYTTPLALGMNPIRAVMRQSLGDNQFQEDLVPTKNGFSLCHALFPRPGRIRNIKGFEDAHALEGVKHIFLFKQVGETIESYQNCADRPCYVIMHASSREKLWQTFEVVKDTLQFETDGCIA
jgi:biotin carboxylase